MFTPINNSKLFEQFIERADYSEDELILIKKLINYLSKSVQSKSCLKGIVIKNNLKKLMCKFSLEFPPYLNELQNLQLLHNKSEYSSGCYGGIYKSFFNNIPVIVKSPLSFKNENITEIFLSFVVINELLIKNKELEKNFIPSYGIFLCDHEYYEKKKIKSMCIENKSDYPNIHLVQKFMDYETFSDCLRYNLLSLSQFKIILRKIFQALSFLENTRFKIYHNDLHSSNILINMKDLEPVILDFGYASFKVGKYKYINSYEESYSEGELIGTGLHDFGSILYSCKKETKTKNKEIIKYCKDLLNTFIFKLLWEEDEIHLKQKSIKTKIFYLYENLEIVEKLLPKKEKKIVHKHNMDILKSMTYSKIVELIF